jgi:16S rRNA (cytosine967-C5)-methyltransferase
LTAATKLVKPGGRIVFSNCSLDPTEGEDIYRALAASTDLETDPLSPGEIGGIDEFLTSEGTLRTTPDGMKLGPAGISGLDGFFAARFRRSL